MNIYDHSCLSVRKFGGSIEDYYAIHKFIDSSKLYYFNVKHRSMLHHLYGIDLCIRKFGDYVVNQQNKTILVRDIAAEHLKEDFSGQVPSLYDWFKDSEEMLAPSIIVPKIESLELRAFILEPLLRSNLNASLCITISNFGVYLVKEFLGTEQAINYQKILSPNTVISQYLTHFKFTERWQYSPDRNELLWLKNNKNG
ncbi:MAG: hypothetical protein AB8G22_20020 [Saprospiraceae bacterium]